MSNLAWDAQLAARIVRPLCNSWVTPNHLTTLRLLTGVGAIFTWLDDLRVFLLVATLITPLMAILVARLYFAQLRKVDF
jgi:phosphatidylglycerophosphate synthase